MSDPTPVEDAEPIDHRDDDAIIAGVVRQAGAEVAKRWTAGHAAPAHSPFEDTRVLVAAIVAVVCLTLASALSTVAVYRSIHDQHRVAEALAGLEARCPVP